MDERIVAKIGGTSGSDAEAVARSMEINRDAVGLVVSAPGALTGEQLSQLPESIAVDEQTARKKVTQLLVGLRDSYEATGELSAAERQLITARYANIVRGLGLPNMDDWLKEIDPRVRQAVVNGADDAFKLGEELMIDVYAAAGWRPIDPSRAGSKLGKDRDAWREFVQTTYSGIGRLVLPGNIDYDGSRLQIFGPGGSDTSGALLAYALQAGTYHNMSDSPLYSFDPRKIGASNARLVEDITYAEGRELGHYGTGLLHPDAMAVLMHSGIPTLVRNTFDHEGAGTRYSDDVEDSRRIGKVVALSLMDVDILRVSEPGSSDSQGFINRLSGILGCLDINIAHIGDYGSDGLLFVLEHNSKKAEEAVRAEQAMRAALSRHASVERSEQTMLSAVGYKINRNKRSIMSALDEVAEANNSELSHSFEGEHAMRITVDRAQQMVALATAHDTIFGTNIDY